MIVKDGLIVYGNGVELTESGALGRNFADSTTTLMNSMFIDLPQPEPFSGGWYTYSGGAVGFSDAWFKSPDSALNIGKKEAKAKIESDRDAIIFDENAVVDIDGVNFQCGPKSLETLTQSIVLFTALGGAPAGYEWRDENNVNHPADLNFLASIGAARATQINQAWQDSWRKKDALEEAKTLEEIDLIIG